MDPRARFRTARVDSEEADPGGVGHPLAASWCLIPDRWAESGRWSDLEDPWLESKGLGGSRQPEAPESPPSRSIRLVAVADEDRPSVVTFRAEALPSWRCSQLQYY